jgi:parallel beta-helix repeat protein
VGFFRFGIIFGIGFLMMSFRLDNAQASLSLPAPGSISGMTFTDPQDECSFIRTALSQLPPDVGGEVSIPDGVYKCSGPIVLDRSNLSLRGEGRVTLALADNVNTPVVVMGDATTPPRPLHNIKVSHLNIDGNRQAQNFECWGGPCDWGGTTHIRNNGITVRGVSGATIKDVYITSARSGGVVTEKGCYYLTIDGLTSTDNEFDGFAGYETSHAVLSNMKLTYNHAAGISADIRFHGNVIENTLIDHNGDVGIFMRDSNGNSFNNLTITDNGNHGIFLARVVDNDSCASGNEFLNLDVERSKGYGFRLNDYCGGIRLTGKTKFLQNRDGCMSAGSDMPIDVNGEVKCED